MKFPKCLGFRNPRIKGRRSPNRQSQEKENIKPTQTNSHPENVVKPQIYNLQQPHQHQSSHYLNSIISHLAALANQYCIASYNYFDKQEDITDYMRAVLLGWLVDVHLKYKLQTQTLFIAINIIDQYLSVKKILRCELQLVGITSIWIAAKYEETYQVPKLSNLVFMCDSTYTSSQILDMEGDILAWCEFNILQPTSFGYLSMINSIIQLSPHEYYLCRYFLELCLFDVQMRKYSPHIIALSTVYFIQKLYPDKQRIYMRFINKFDIVVDNTILKQCAREICLLWQKSKAQHLNSLNNKFSTETCLGVSNLQISKFIKQKQMQKKQA